MIEAYSFGSIEVRGKEYQTDLVIYPDRIDGSWWRKEGHSLCVDDIRAVLDYQPEILIVGQGKPGLMKIPRDVRDTIEKRGIELFTAPTEKAVEKYNEVCSERKTVAALHLTC